MKKQYIPPESTRCFVANAEIMKASTNNEGYDGGNKTGIPGGGENDDPNFPVEAKGFSGGVSDWETTNSEWE